MPSPMTLPGRSDRRALIVGADPATLQLCRDALESSGFAVDAVDRGIDAIIAAREDLPDLIFVDVQLRDVPGREAIKWLRSIPALQLTPVIILAAEAEDDSVLAVTQPRLSLHKPASLAAIRRTIHEVLEYVSGLGMRNTARTETRSHS
jgi:DNA-binding response OmpR family regulator